MCVATAPGQSNSRCRRCPAQCCEHPAPSSALHSHGPPDTSSVVARPTRPSAAAPSRSTSALHQFHHEVQPPQQTRHLTRALQPHRRQHTPNTALELLADASPRTADTCTSPAPQPPRGSRRWSPEGTARRQGHPLPRHRLPVFVEMQQRYVRVSTRRYSVSGNRPPGAYLMQSFLRHPILAHSLPQPAARPLPVPCSTSPARAQASAR